MCPLTIKLHRAWHKAVVLRRVLYEHAAQHSKQQGGSQTCAISGHLHLRCDDWATVVTLLSGQRCVSE
jgi:hypothetical protein